MSLQGDKLCECCTYGPERLNEIIIEKLKIEVFKQLAEFHESLAQRYRMIVTMRADS